MIEWVNLLLLIFFTIIALYYYIKSVQPAKLEQEIGEIAYEKCERYRVYASIPFLFFFVSYVLYVFYPLPLPIPNELPWDYSISIILAIIMAIPSFALMGLGVRAAGEETLRPKKEHEMYGGIYNKIRHPQALGEVWVAHILGLILNRTFLFLFAFVWIPVFYYMSVVEERDLILRYGEPYFEYRERVGMFFPKRAKTPVKEE
ncbi:MAG: methyltransferase family protein [Candidatus Thorarchaeota archaeon]